MVRIAILGATGYTALELIKLLLRHPGAKIEAVTSRQEGRVPISGAHPSLTGRLELYLEDLSPEAVSERCDCAFLCLPHAASAEAAKALLARGVRVIDLRFVFTDATDYAQSSPIEPSAAGGGKIARAVSRAIAGLNERERGCRVFA